MKISEQSIPVNTVHLFPVLDKLLIALLKSLTIRQWNAPTIANHWTVKDIASHLSDGNLRTISILRDNYSGESSADIHSYKDLVDFLNQLNKSWNEATKRLSPQVLIELMESTGKQFCEQIALLRQFGAAVFSKGISPEEALPVVEISGDRQLGAVAMQMVSVMA